MKGFQKGHKIVGFIGKRHSSETKALMRLAKLGDQNPMKNPEIIKRRLHTITSNQTYVGENNPKWRGGDARYRGVGWHQAKIKRREFDNYKCVDCGKPQSEMKISLDVHHIIEYKNGGTNDLNNLVSLCRSCHNKRRKCKSQ